MLGYQKYYFILFNSQLFICIFKVILFVLTSCYQHIVYYYSYDIFICMFFRIFLQAYSIYNKHFYKWSSTVCFLQMFRNLLQVSRCCQGRNMQSRSYPQICENSWHNTSQFCQQISHISSKKAYSLHRYLAQKATKSICCLNSLINRSQETIPKLTRCRNQEWFSIIQDISSNISNNQVYYICRYCQMGTLMKKIMIFNLDMQFFSSAHNFLINSARCLLFYPSIFIFYGLGSSYADFLSYLQCVSDFESISTYFIRVIIYIIIYMQSCIFLLFLFVLFFNGHTQRRVFFYVYNWIQSMIISFKLVYVNQQNLILNQDIINLNMKQSLIQVVDIAGNSAVCFEADSIENLSKLYAGHLLRITPRGLTDFGPNPQNWPLQDERFRFVLAKTQQERAILLRVEPIRCYLRDHEMKSSVIEVNPYQSVRWLRNLVEKQRKIQVTLIVNEKVLTDETDSLLNHVSENSIIHVVQNQQIEKVISIIYTKQPGAESTIFKLENISAQKTVDELARQISSLIGLPYQTLVLVYAGRILIKDKVLADYRILTNGIIYAVDQKKFMRKVTKQQYQTKLEEIRKSKQSYKELMSKIKSGEKSVQSSGIKVGESKISNRGIAKNIQQQSGKKGVYQKSGTIMDGLEDDIKYFRDPTMKIESEQLQQLNKRTDNNKGEQEQLQSPIYIFNRMQSHKSVNAQLKQGRVVTTQTDVYQDPYGFTHQHSKQRTLFKNGRTKIVDVDVAEDQEGNIVKIEKDIVNIKRDSKTGNIVRSETDIIQDSKNGKTIVKKHQVRDEDGNLINEQTQIIKNENGHKQIKKHQRGFERVGEKLIQINNEVLQDNKGNPYRIQSDRIQKKQDKQGNTNEYSKDIREQNGVTSVIERNIIRDKDGNIMQQKTDVIEIRQDQDGNIYKHQHNQINTENKIVTIDRDIVTDSAGEVVSKETKMEVVEEDDNLNVVKRETDVIQQSDGRTIVIEKSCVQDAQGNVIKQDSQMFQLHKQDQSHQQQILVHEEPQAVVIEGQREPMINGGKQISIDQLGNTHTHEKQLIQKEGKTTFVDRDTIQNQRGEILRVQTDIVEIEGDQQGNMHKHKSSIIEQNGRVTMVETDQIMNPDGILLRKEKDTIQIQQGDDGSVFKHQKDVIEEEGKTKIIQRDIIEDNEGQVIKSQTKVTEIQDGEDAVEVREKQELIQAVDADQVALQGEQEVENQVQVIEDQQGNVMRRQQKVTQNEEGQKTFVDRCTIENADGEVIRQQTQIIHVTENEQGPQVHRHAIDYSQQNNKVLIEQTTSKENMDGSIIKAQKDIIQIEQLEDGTVHKKQTQVLQQDGRKIVHVRDLVEDQEGRLISKTSDHFELQSFSDGNLPLPIAGDHNVGEVDNIERANFERTQHVDSQGYIHVVETEVKNSNGQETQIQRQYISTPEGQIIKTETGITHIKERSDGTTKLTAIDIIQQGNITTVVQNDTIQDEDGNEIRADSGTLTIKQLQGGIKKKVKENIIEQNGIRLKVQKQTYEDADGNIIQQKTNTTQLIDRYDQSGNIMLASEGFKRKQQQVKQDEDGNYHFYQRQIIDDQPGKTTVVETQVIRNEQNQLLQATTDVIQMTRQQDGSVNRHEVNIVQLPGKVSVAESNARQNADGERLEGEVESVVVTRGSDGEIIKRQTGIIMQDCQKTIVEKTIVEDEQGNILKEETTKKRIYTDEKGIQQGRDYQIYRTDEIQIQGQPSTIQKQVTIDIQGNVISNERLTTVKDEGEDEVVQVVNVKVVTNPDGNIVDQSMNVTKIIRSEDGTVEVIENNVPIQNNFGGYQQVDSQIRQIAPERENQTTLQTQVLEDENGNLHTFQKQRITKQDGSETVIKSQTVQNAQGHLLTINTNVVDIQPLSDGKILTHTTDILSGDKVVTTETFMIQNMDGSILSQKTRKVQVSEDDGLIKTNTTDIMKKDGRITIDNVQMLQDEDGNIIDQNSHKLEIQDTQQAVREQAKKVARAELMGEVTGLVTQMREDQFGNRHLIETQTIEDHGKRIVVDSETIQNIDGEVIRVQTDILQEQKLEDGKVEKHKTIITEEGGNIKVMQYSEIRDDEANIQILNQQASNRIMVGGQEEDDGKEDLLGFEGQTRGNQSQRQGGIQIELQQQQGNKQQQANLLEGVDLLNSVNVGASGNKVEFVYETRGGDNEPGQVNLLDSSKRISQLPIQSKKIIQPPSSNPPPPISQIKQSPSEQPDQSSINPKQHSNKKELSFPQQYEIKLISKQGNTYNVMVRYDEIMDEVAAKLQDIIGVSKYDVKFYRNGEQLEEYEMVSDLNIGPGDEVYFDV